MANIILDKNKVNKEPENNRIANDGGVGSIDLLGIWASVASGCNWGRALLSP
ncbi:MAG: hypothetical protein ACYSTS_07085 [Planctomycetota bacterium]